MKDLTTKYARSFDVEILIVVEDATGWNHLVLVTVNILGYEISFNGLPT